MVDSCDVSTMVERWSEKWPLNGDGKDHASNVEERHARTCSHLPLRATGDRSSLFSSRAYYQKSAEQGFVSQAQAKCIVMLRQDFDERLAILLSLCDLPTFLALFLAFGAALQTPLMSVLDSRESISWLPAQCM